MKVETINKLTYVLIVNSKNPLKVGGVQNNVKSILFKMNVTNINHLIHQGYY